MKVKEIYLKIKKEITKGMYNYDDQITAISKWIESEFEPKNKNIKLSKKIIRHSDEMIDEEYVYKKHFIFQRTQKHGVWFVTYQNHIITFGQYRHDIEDWIDENYTPSFADNSESVKIVKDE